MPPLLPSFCLQQVVWPMKLLHSIRGSLPAWPPNGTNPMLQRCHGYAADSPSPCSVLPYSVSGVPVRAVDTPPSPLLHQWTWSTPNWTSRDLITQSCKTCFFLFHSFTFTCVLYHSVSTYYTQFVVHYILKK